MRQSAAKCLTLGLLTLSAGCGPKISEAELGEVVYEANRLPGFAKPYALPKLDGIQRNSEGAGPDTLETIRKAMETSALIEGAGAKSPRAETAPAQASPEPPAAAEPPAEPASAPTAP